MNKLLLPVLLGTSREGRRSEHVANVLLSALQQREDIESQLVDVRDFDLSRNDGHSSNKERYADWQALMERADGLVIVSPEYNHGYPGSLKSVLDMLFEEYQKKAVGLAGVSKGGFGGVRVIQSLQPVMYELGMPIAATLPFSKVAEVFDDSGQLIEVAYESRIERFVDELVWMATTLRWGRTNLDRS